MSSSKSYKFQSPLPTFFFGLYFVSKRVAAAFLVSTSKSDVKLADMSVCRVTFTPSRPLVIPINLREVQTFYLLDRFSRPTSILLIIQYSFT